MHLHSCVNSLYSAAGPLPLILATVRTGVVIQFLSPPQSRNRELLRGRFSANGKGDGDRLEEEAENLYKNDSLRQTKTLAPLGA